MKAVAKTKQLVVRLPASEAVRMDALAKSLRVSKSALARKAMGLGISRILENPGIFEAL